MDIPVSARAEGRLRDPILVLGALVLVAAGIALAGELSVLVAFSALAAIVCRRAQLWFVDHGMRGWLALSVTIVLFSAILVILGLTIIASAGAVALEVSGQRGEIEGWVNQAQDLWGSTTGVPAGELPAVDVSSVIAFARGIASWLVPTVATLAMSVLVVTYLLIDASRLRARMLDATSATVVARYDRLAGELVTYVRVRALLGGAAAVADTALLLVLGVPYAVLWGVVSFLMSFIPNLGFVLALVPPAVFALLHLGPAAAIWVVVGYVAINLAFDYVLQPRMLASSLDLSPVVVILTIVVWTVLIGPAGALLAVPMTIALRAVLAPFPGARWFLALLGPLPAEARPVAPADGVTDPTAEAAAGRPAGAPAADPTIET